MAEIVRILGLTGLVRQSTITVNMTMDAIQSIVDRVAGERAIPLGVEHDPLCLPIGKVIEAWIEPYGSEYAAVGRIYIEDRLVHVRIDSETELVQLDFAACPKPFQRKGYKPLAKNRDSVSVDLNDFNARKDYDQFTLDVNTIDDNILCDSNIMRHSIDPEPIIQFAIGSSIGTFLLKPLIGYAYNRMLDGISDLLIQKIKRVFSAYKTHRNQDKRNAVVQIVAEGEIEMVLLVKVKPGAEFPELEIDKIRHEVNKYASLSTDIDSITLALSDSGDWEFQYMTTRSGKVVGTRDCYKYTLDRLNETGNSSSEISPEE